MTARDSFVVYLHRLAASDVSFRVLDDGRRVLQITDDISLYVRPGDDLDAVIAGLRKLADAAGEMAGALGGGEDLADEPGEDTRRLAAIREVLRHFDWEHDDRQYALEAIERIAEGGQA